MTLNKPQFTVQLIEEKPGFGRFAIEPLPQGYGATIGNALRRVLYTSIPGAAITSVAISGATHQFASIPGVKEDVVYIILALKQVRFAYTGDKSVRLTLTAKGPGEVTAAQFELPGDVKIVNPDLVLAHLSDKSSKLEIEATLESGLGYSPAEERKISTVGVMPVDANFTPVTRVNYTVEATRVGRVTNFDKILLDITTDGSVSPLEALESASRNLVEYFSAIVNPENSATGISGSSSGSPKSYAGSSVSVEELDLPTRIANALQKAGFQTVADMLSVSRAELAKVKNLGGKSVKIVETALRDRGFELAQ